KLKRSKGVKSDWSDVPFDVLVMIVEILIYMKDQVYFGAVCVSWNSACAEYHSQRRTRLQQLSLLTLTQQNRGGKEVIFFYSIVERRFYVFETPVPLRSCFPCSTNEWVAVMFKVVLSADPASASDYRVCAMYADFPGDVYRLALLKHGAKGWTLLEYDDDIRDVTFYKHKFYAVNSWRQIAPQDALPTTSTQILAKNMAPVPSPQSLWNKQNLILCPERELGDRGTPKEHVNKRTAERRVTSVAANASKQGSRPNFRQVGLFE
ncbi:hypothetical protein GIB67_037222, partial [Kingdonia uniflora]